MNMAQQNVVILGFRHVESKSGLYYRDNVVVVDTLINYSDKNMGFQKPYNPIYW